MAKEIRTKEDMLVWRLGQMAEENADLAIKYGVKQAPTLVIVTGAGFEKFAGAGAIKQFLSK